MKSGGEVMGKGRRRGCGFEEIANSFQWVWCSMIICVIWPVVESRVTIWRIMRGVVRDAGTGGKGKAGQAEVSA